MVHKTVEDNRHAAQLRAAADADYLKVMGTARREATNVREEARAEGRKIVDDATGPCQRRSLVGAPAGQ